LELEGKADESYEYNVFGGDLKSWHIDLLVDPISHSPLELRDPIWQADEIVGGWLQSDSSSYPIRNGIPRFVQNEGYSGNFGFQWEHWPTVQFESENLGGPMHGWTEAMFRKITVSKSEDYAGKLVLDLGCGSGRFADRVIDFGGTAIGVDYSSAIDVARKNLHEKSPDSLWVQADALHLPFKNGCLDAGYSIGVLHHTPNPSLGINEARRVLKGGSRFSVSVYPKGGFYGWPTVRMIRGLLNLLPLKMRLRMALLYSEALCRLLQPIGDFFIPLTYPVRLFLPTIYLPDVRWSILDTFDSITTTFQSTHSSEEVRNWFSLQGFEAIQDGDWGEGNITGLTPGIG
jgi:ubiquinone/menaquinone biosynthesis C-methylase UbiE